MHKAILLRSDVFVEYPPRTRIEGGIQRMPEDFPVSEIRQVMTGQIPGRTGDRQITLFDSLGFATGDFSTLRYVHDRIRGTGLYRNRDLLTDPHDPRDLSGMLERTSASLKAA